MSNKIGKDILHAAQILRDGELVGIPTETVYGLAGNALNEISILKIFSAKNRPQFNPLIVHISSIYEMELYAKDIPIAAQKLAREFWPGPLTLILDKKDIISDLITAGSKKLALRVPNHPMALTLLGMLPFPLAAPSANPSGYISPTSAEHVAEQLLGKLKYILDGGNCETGIESTVVGFDDQGNPIVYRKGKITSEQISSVTGLDVLEAKSDKSSQGPGIHGNHYAPKTPFLLGDLEKLIKEHSMQKIGVLSLQKKLDLPETAIHLVLSKEGNLEEAAKNLFSFMRKLDSEKLEIILAEKVPNKGIGIAINDRLERAALKKTV